LYKTIDFDAAEEEVPQAVNRTPAKTPEAKAVPSP
jgi:hypothetical protein